MYILFVELKEAYDETNGRKFSWTLQKFDFKKIKYLEMILNNTGNVAKVEGMSAKSFGEAAFSA